MIFCGDTLFAGSVGRSDFPGGDGKALVRGIRDKLFTLADRMVFPGHGPETTIQEEKTSNPFFGTFFNI
jgi:glyoxylase-like metal-dependent hydrolase (beta-lactamase superfamily II)